VRILFFGNNWVGWQVAAWLRAQGEEIVGLVLHPLDRRRYGEEIIRDTGVGDGQIFDGSRLRDPEITAAIADLRADLGLSAMFGYILRREILDLLPEGCVNIHPSLLPYNRGAYPNVWSIVEGTPAGVSMHYIDQGVDTGDIIAQLQVEVEPIDTGASLYRKLEQASLELFYATWPRLRMGEVARIPQPQGIGSMHRMRDVAKIDEIDLDQTYTARQLLDILRARTFPPHKGAYIHHGQQKIYLRIELDYEQPSE
jgi:methionyl-tRNA formyltransferase